MIIILLFILAIIYAGKHINSHTTPPASSLAGQLSADSIRITTATDTAKVSVQTSGKNKPATKTTKKPRGTPEAPADRKSPLEQPVPHNKDDR